MTTFLVVLVVCLALISVAQIMSILKLSSAKEVTDADNDFHGKLLLFFMFAYLIFAISTMFYWGGVILPKSASVHGEEVDSLMDISLVIILTVFFITQPVLFYFCYKYRGNSTKKAKYVEHNNKLELIWTIIPSITLAILILYGLNTWVNITSPSFEGEDPLVIELYSKQFQWQARYAGKDNVLGKANVRFVEGKNTMGIDMDDLNGKDDVMVGEIHLPVGRSVLFKFRSQDVIHSAYMPHFRAQMNCIPGMITQFSFTPSVTTEDMRLDEKVIRQVNDINKIRKVNGQDEYEFDYLLLCNKICGGAHYNMQMKIIVEEQEQFNEWLRSKDTFEEYIK
ncbi:cytochrome c oxidase subunit II [Ichthyobacterium seriolicida]|uniref:Cytochrome c oxidase subunit 2 n=1 Tax=Ichthyobacterium seriolicida TaxID=242600 RepID=A0A1J1DYJ6_9FLAO|nr:cytochrome c oxidase subunit II [Ichthyobacterium seriolicida]BAV94953.1 cytochrome c oxidase polypeptide II [Ichthyobacterium seriolicida]